jgi:signal transduction histidine kinase/ActR/RegA family two-component response regulator
MSSPSHSARRRSLPATLLRLVVSLWVLFCSLPASAASTGPEIDAWFDPGGEKSLQQLLDSKTAWRPLTERRFNHGPSAGALWLRIGVSPGIGSGYLYLDNPLLTDIQVFLADRSSRILHTGHGHPVTTRPIRTTQWALPMEPNGQQLTTFYVRIRSNISLRSQVEWLTASQLPARQASANLPVYAYYGLTLIMAAFYSLVYLNTRERVYLWFTLGLVSFLVSQLQLDGTLLLFAHPQHPAWSYPVMHIALLGIVFFTWRFARDFLGLEDQQPLTSRVMRTANRYALFLIAAMFVLPEQVTLWMTLPYLIAGGVLCLAAGIKPLRQHDRNGQYYMLAISAVSIFSLVYIAMILGLFDSNAFLELSLKLASATQVLVLGFALLNKYREVHDENNNYQQMMVDTLFEANRIKDEFMNIISHELRTPLNGIQGALDMMRGHPLDEIQVQNVGMAETSLHEMLKMIDSILDWTELNNDTMDAKTSPFGLRNDLSRLVEALRKRSDTSGIPISLDIAADVNSHYSADSGKFFKIFRCLFDNAIKFGERQPVDITVRRLTQAGGRDLLELVIADRGPGIPADRLQEMFEAFTQGETGLTRRFQGLGLGLPIARGMARVIGGQVNLEPRDGGGTRARVVVSMVPVAAPAPPPAPVAQAANDAPLKPMRMLVVEDNLVNQKVLTAILTKIGGEVSVAGDGQQAVDKARDEQFDFIWMDCQMPVMDGLEATRWIRQFDRYKKIPIVAVTANAMAEDEKRCLEAGMNDFLAKPVNKGAVERMLRKWSQQQAA